MIYRVHFEWVNFELERSDLTFSVKPGLIATAIVVVQTPQIIFAQGISPKWAAQNYQSSLEISTPGHIAGGETQSLNNNCPVEGKPLTALVPSSGFGVTVAAYPTFFVYMPAPSSQVSTLQVEFVLTDSENNQVYQSQFETNRKAGIITISLPSAAGLAPLEIGQDYRWSFSIICQPSDRSQNMIVEGLIRRVQLDPTLETQLAQASPERQFELYAERKIWQDALATLVQMRRNRPSDPQLAARWVQLLNAEGLGDLAQESLVSTPSN